MNEVLQRPPLPLLHPQMASGKFAFPGFGIPLNLHTKSSLDDMGSASSSPNGELKDYLNGNKGEKENNNENLLIKQEENSNSSVEDLSTSGSILLNKIKDSTNDTLKS